MAVFPRTTLAWNPYESYLSWFDDYRNYISDSAAKIPENISRVSKKIVRILPEIKNIKTDILSSDIGRHFYICFYIFYLRQDPYYFFGYPRYIFRYLCSRIGNIISVI